MSTDKKAATEKSESRSRARFPLFLLLIAGVLLLPAWSGGPWGQRGWTWPPMGETPYMEILEVEQDVSVTINAYRFPVGTELVATMGYMGTRGVNGYEVESFTVDTEDEFERTFAIPSELAGEYQISIRLEESDASYPYYAFNWFYNNSTLP